MKLIAIKTFSYAGKRLAVGDIFETKSDRDAKLLVGIKNARTLEERVESKVPAPDARLVSRANNRVSLPKEEVKPAVAPAIEIETESESEPEVTPEPEKEPAKPEPAVEPEPVAEPVKPEPKLTTQNSRRTYNRKQ